MDRNMNRKIFMDNTIGKLLDIGIIFSTKFIDIHGTNGNLKISILGDISYVCRQHVPTFVLFFKFDGKGNVTITSNGVQHDGSKIVIKYVRDNDNIRKELDDEIYDTFNVRLGLND